MIIVPEANYESWAMYQRSIVIALVVIVASALIIDLIWVCIKKRERKKMEKLFFKYPSQMGLRNPESAAAAKTVKAVADAASIKPKRV